MSFAKQMGGELLSNVDQTVSAPMEMVVNHERHGVALLRAGQFATVQTRSLGDKDHVCGNESTFYHLSRPSRTRCRRSPLPTRTAVPA